MLAVSCSVYRNDIHEMKQNSGEKSYLALGDSYTIGEGVEENERWPVQVIQQFNERFAGNQLKKPDIVATTGWTTDELLEAIRNSDFQNQYDLVSLLIGVNNQYRSYPINQFEEEFTQLLNFAIEKAGDPGHVFVVSIPDWGVMPFAAGSDRNKIAQEIDLYNQLEKEICTKAGVIFIDITDISRDAEKHPEYIASDDLHPSGKQYAAWTERILPYIHKLLGE